MRPIAAFSMLAAALVLAAPAAAQNRARGVSPDDSVVASDALLRVRELGDAGNTPEALRVLQSILENEGDRLLPTASDPELYVPVRGLVHEMLLANPELLARYRDQEGPRAAQLLATGSLEAVERYRFLTPAGLEATMRLAQRQLEAGRFEAARLTLEQAERHPDRSGRASVDAAHLGAMIATYLPRPALRDRVARWAREGGAEPPVIGPTPPTPAKALPARGPLDTGPGVDVALLPAEPLQSVAIEAVRPLADEEMDIPAAWIFPSLLGDSVFLSDGRTLSAWDSTTLAPLWSAALTPAPRATERYEQFAAMVGFATVATDAASPVGGGGVVVAPGLAGIDPRRGEKRLSAFDVSNGSLLWALDPATLDDRLKTTVLRGVPLIDADTLVLGLRDQAPTSRVHKLYLAGLDLYSGNIRWLRLVGSVGTNPWGRMPSRPESGVLHEGVIYRGDEMGIVGAFEAATGRAVWVRVTSAKSSGDPMSFNRAPAPPPYETVQPIIDDDNLWYIEPGRGQIVQLSRTDGTKKAARDPSVFGEPRYALKVGGSLAMVGVGRVAFIDASSFAEGSPRLSPEYRETPIAGRGAIAGDRLLMPLVGGISVLDPAAPSSDTRAPMSATGNMLVVAPGNGQSHLVTADAIALHTFVAWDQAQALLDRRVAQSPKDPAPLLTYVELVHRGGRAERVPALADAALSLLDAGSVSEAGVRQRKRLFELLMSMVNESRAAWKTPQGEAPAHTISDPALLDQILDRVSRAAESPVDQATYWLSRAWLHEVQNRPELAIESYQQILIDPALGEVRAPSADASDESLAFGSTASDQAAARMGALLRRVGPQAYAAFDEEARLATDQLPANASPEQCISLARRYPAAGVTPELWRRAAEALASTGKNTEARRAAGAGLHAAELAAGIGRADQLPVIGRLAGTLMRLATSRTDAGGVYRMLRRLEREHARALIVTDQGSMPAEQAARGLLGALAARAALPMVGTPLAGGQVIEHYTPLTPMFTHGTGASTDSVVMADEEGKRVALWAVSAEDGMLRPVWTRPVEGEVPAVIRVTHDLTILHWPSIRGGRLEAIGLDSRTAWRTGDFLDLFAPGSRAGDPNERIATPLDGQVRADDLIVSMDDSTLVLVQRSGLAAAIDLAKGALLWAAPLEFSRVFEAAHVNGSLIVGGATRPGEGRPLSPGVMSLDARTGAVRARLSERALGDHPRWIRATPQGDAVLASSNGLLRFDPVTGQTRWEVIGEPGRASISGWIVGESLFVLDSDLRLWRVSLADGKTDTAPLSARDKITLPVQASVWQDRLALLTSQGVLVYDASGKLVGADSLDSARLETPVPSEHAFVAVDLATSAFGAPEGEVARVHFLANPSGKVIATERVRLFAPPSSVLLLDGKVVIGQELATIVLDAPVSPDAPVHSAP